MNGDGTYKFEMGRVEFTHAVEPTSTSADPSPLLRTSTYEIPHLVNPDPLSRVNLGPTVVGLRTQVNVSLDDRNGWAISSTQPAVDAVRLVYDHDLARGLGRWLVAYAFASSGAARVFMTIGGNISLEYNFEELRGVSAKLLVRLLPKVTATDPRWMALWAAAAQSVPNLDILEFTPAWWEETLDREEAVVIELLDVGVVDLAALASLGVNGEIEILTNTGIRSRATAHCPVFRKIWQGERSLPHSPGESLEETLNHL